MAVSPAFLQVNKLLWRHYFPYTEGITFLGLPGFSDEPYLIELNKGDFTFKVHKVLIDRDKVTPKPYLVEVNLLNEADEGNLEHTLQANKNDLPYLAKMADDVLREISSNTDRFTWVGEKREVLGKDGEKLGVVGTVLIDLPPEVSKQLVSGAKSTEISENSVNKSPEEKNRLMAVIFAGEDGSVGVLTMYQEMEEITKTVAKDDLFRISRAIEEYGRSLGLS